MAISFSAYLPCDLALSASKPIKLLTYQYMPKLKFVDISKMWHTTRNMIGNKLVSKLGKVLFSGNLAEVLYNFVFLYPLKK